MTLSISEVAARSGLSVDALRYYEREGLLPAQARDGGGRRVYDPAVLDQLAVVLALRQSGFGIREVRAFLSGARTGGTVAARLDAAAAALDELDAVLADRSARLRHARGVVRRWRREVDRGRTELDLDRRLACAEDEPEA